MGRLLAPNLDRGAPARLSSQLTESIRDQIKLANLVDGDRLPSTRALAAELGVARGVVQQSYDQLIAEGWLRAAHGSGTFVNAQTDLPRTARPLKRAAPAPRPALISLRPGEPWGPNRSDALWRRAWREVAQNAPPYGYPDPRGDAELRARLTEHLALSRGLSCDPDQIVVTSGTTHGLSLAFDALRGVDRTIVVENPGYPSARRTADLHGWSAIPVAVDRNGIDTSALPATATAAYVTPAHQYPSGALLSAERRTALCSWAQSTGALIVEDDYDSEYRYDLAPLPPLTALAPESTLYLGTVSKTLGAGIRFGWAVAPPALVGRIVDVRIARHDYPSWTTGRAMTALLRDGAWQRATRRARKRYAERDAFVTEQLSPYGELLGAGAGLHSVLVLPRDIEEAVVAGCREAGVEIAGLSEYHAGPGAGYGLVLGYGNVDDNDLHLGIGTVREQLDRAGETAASGKAETMS